MEHTAPAILELGLLLVLATLAGKAARRLGLPAVLGYLAVGLLVSPFTPGYTANREQLAVLADIGVVLLLFEVGIEINPIHLARQRRLLVLAPAQVFITWGVAAAVCALVALGTVIDPAELGGALPWLALILGLVVAAKVVPAWALARFGRLQARPLQLAIGLGQVGEFSYVLGALALTAGIITNQVETALVAAVAITIAASSVLVRLAHRPPPHTVGRLGGGAGTGASG